MDSNNDLTTPLLGGPSSMSTTRKRDDAADEEARNMNAGEINLEDEGDENNRNDDQEEAIDEEWSLIKRLWNNIIHRFFHNEGTENDINDGEDTNEEEQGLHVSSSDHCCILQTSLFPDLPSACDATRHHSGGGTYAPIPMVATPSVSHFFKFVVITVVWIVLFHELAKTQNWEGDYHGNTLLAIVQYQTHGILLDMATFFVVARCPKHVDTLEFVGTMVLASIYTSYSYTWKFLDHSLTWYEIRCTWPLSLWLYAAFILVLGITLIGLHIHHYVVVMAVSTAEEQSESVDEDDARARLRSSSCVWVSKLLEVLVVTIAVLLPPILSSPTTIHLHHWLAGWLIGMHANIVDRWWSRVTQAWCWGLYINGIATWGRDPPLMCSIVDYYAHDLHCYSSSAMMTDGAKVSSQFWSTLSLEGLTATCSS